MVTVVTFAICGVSSQWQRVKQMLFVGLLVQVRGQNTCCSYRLKPEQGSKPRYRASVHILYTSAGDSVEKAQFHTFYPHLARLGLSPIWDYNIDQALLN